MGSCEPDQLEPKKYKKIIFINNTAKYSDCEGNTCDRCQTFYLQNNVCYNIPQPEDNNIKLPTFGTKTVLPSFIHSYRVSKVVN